MRLVAILLASSTLLLASGADNPRVPRATIVNVEKLINTQIASMYPEEPYFLLGTARGTYIEGFGAVFSVEINLAMGPSLSPFKASVSKEEIARHREKKEARLPGLRNTMYSVVSTMTSYLETLPANEEFVLSVTLLRYPWEETTVQPSQIVMRVQRNKLMEAQRTSARNPKNPKIQLQQPAAATVIRVQEY